MILLDCPPLPHGQWSFWWASKCYSEVQRLSQWRLPRELHTLLKLKVEIVMKCLDG
jgi:hypothetical protein